MEKSQQQILGRFTRYLQQNVMLTPSLFGSLISKGLFDDDSIALIQVRTRS